jgi:REP element-mobilizing transposase RayT
MEKKMRKPRICFPNAIYHIYSQGVNKSVIYSDEEDNLYWVKLLKQSKDRFQIKIFCFITMRNHYHCLVQTPGANISKVMRFIGWRFSHHMKRKYGRVGPLFRSRFQGQLVQSDQYLRAVVRYIHNNPVAAGLAPSVCEAVPGICTSYFHLVGSESAYPWLDKEGLLSLLKNPDKTEGSMQLFDGPIGKEEFSILTKIERITNAKPMSASKELENSEYLMAG